MTEGKVQCHLKVGHQYFIIYKLTLLLQRRLGLLPFFASPRCHQPCHLVAMCDCPRPNDCPRPPHVTPEDRTVYPGLW